MLLPNDKPFHHGLFIPLPEMGPDLKPIYGDLTAGNIVGDERALEKAVSEHSHPDDVEDRRQDDDDADEDWKGQGPWGQHGGRPAGRTEGRRDGLDTVFERVMAHRVMVTIKTIVSLGFVGLCLYILCKGWLDNKNTFFKSIPGWGVGIMFCIIGFYLIAILEGLEVCVVQFKALTCDYFRDSHPRAYYIMKRIKTGSNVDYFIQGRQVMMTFSVFFASHFTAFDSTWEDWPDPPHGRMSNGFKTAFLQYSLAGLIITVFVCQIPTQLICSRVPVTMMNLFFNPVLTETALFIEWIGLTTATKLVAAFWLQTLFKDPPVPNGVVSHHGVDHRQSENRRFHPIVEYFRLFLRACFVLWVLFCLYLVCSGFVSNQGEFLTNVPGVARGAIYFAVAFYIVSMCEALQIGIVKCYGVDCSWFKDSHPGAYKIMNLCKRGNNLNRFLVGRQLLVTAGAFLASNLNAFGTWDRFQYTDTKYPSGFQTVMIQYSVAGAFVTVLLAQLVPRIVAAGAPIAVMNMPGNYWIVRVCHFIESSGIGEASNFIADCYLYFLTKTEPTPPMDLYRAASAGAGEKKVLHDHHYMFSYDSASMHESRVAPVPTVPGSGDAAATAADK